MNRIIRTLIVDDSAFVRKVVREMLSRSPYIEVVGAARDGQEALEMVEQLNPDVITCDLMMPRMDGIEFVREQMRRRPLPILILTALEEGGEKALQAMEAGALDIVQKPTALANDKLLEIQEDLVEKIKAVALVPPKRLQSPAAPEKSIKRSRPPTGLTKIVVIGISTGGPQALRFLLPQFPADFPVPIAVVLHMPVGYIQMFAQKLDEISKLEIREVQEGDKLEAGKVYFAQAGRHFFLRRQSESTVVAELPLTPVAGVHRPAADLLFQSAADCYGSGVLGIVMTGMGDDGKRGAAWIKSQGGTILTEAEESCVIYGMPRSVVEAGLSDGSASLEKMAEKIMETL
jgi:two-component system, chemotaxis family, protein-glutamate methylesterase/glutaminase